MGKSDPPNAKNKGFVTEIISIVALVVLTILFAHGCVIMMRDLGMLMQNVTQAIKDGK